MNKGDTRKVKVVHKKQIEDVPNRRTVSVIKKVEVTNVQRYSQPITESKPTRSRPPRTRRRRERKRESDVIGYIFCQMYASCRVLVGSNSFF
jgi:hypothetical protein